MATILASNYVTTFPELKSSPRKVLEIAGEKPVAVLRNNKPFFYCVSPETFERMMDIIEDVEIMKIIEERKDLPKFKVSLDDL